MSGATIVFLDVRTPPMFVEATSLFIEHCQRALATVFLMRHALKISESISVYRVGNDRVESILEHSDVRSQLHSLARLAPVSDDSSSSAHVVASMIQSAIVDEPQSSILFLTSFMPSESEMSALVAAIRGKVWREFSLFVVDLGVHVVGSNDLASILSLLTAETIATSSMCTLTRVMPAQLADSLLAHTVSNSPHLILGACSILLSSNVAIGVQVRRAIAPPLPVQQVRLCRCHNARVTTHASRMYCPHTTMVDRFDVVDCIEVGGAHFQSLAPPPSSTTVGALPIGPYTACTIAPIDLQRMGGSDGSAPLAIVPHLVPRDDADAFAAMAETTANVELFIATRNWLVNQQKCLVVRSTVDRRLFALSPVIDGANTVLMMHLYLPAPPLLQTISSSQAGDNEKKAATVSFALEQLGGQPISDSDDGFALWRHEQALAPLMQASSTIQQREQQALEAAAPTPIVLPTARSKKRRLQQVPMNI